MKIHAAEEKVRRPTRAIVSSNCGPTPPPRESLEAASRPFSRSHQCGMFVKHGITLIGFWTPADEPRSKNTLIYILAYPRSRIAAKNPLEGFPG